MKTPSISPGQTFGEYAYQAIEQHFKKSTKHEAVVLKDEDPEALHQMRVGMRRLRTALNVFGPALVLPRAASEKRIGRIARRLGAVRDLDVLQIELKNHASQVKGEERKQIEQVLHNLHKQRRQDFEQLEDTLDSSRYEKLKRAFSDWLEAPKYEAIAHLPIVHVLPDLLLPLISQVLLHPGWLVGTVAIANGLPQPQPLNANLLAQQLAEKGELLHDLRKLMKQVRYQTEFFVDFYDAAYAEQVEDFKQVQEVLGQLQDSAVMMEFLADQVEADLERVLPTFAQQLQQSRLSTWHTWQTIQQRYLDPSVRSDLRLQVMTPRQPQTETPSMASAPEKVPTGAVNGKS